MGFTPAQVDAMSVWEFRAAWGGYVEANTMDDEEETPPAPSPEEYHDMVRRLG